jgi:hypothetical protein
VNTDGSTLLVDSLRKTRSTKPSADGPEMLPFRLLMAHPLVDPTFDHPTLAPPGNALRAALAYAHDADVILQVLGAYPNAALAILERSKSAAARLLDYPTLARTYLPSLATLSPERLFQHRFDNAGDFAGELVQFADDLLWAAVTSRIPKEFRLSLRENPPCTEPADWRYRDGLRAAICGGMSSPGRALWLLDRTGDDELNAYDCGGRTVLMRAIITCCRNAKRGAVGDEAPNEVEYRNLIRALLARAPILDISLYALDSPGDSESFFPTLPPTESTSTPGRLARSSIIPGKTAHGFFTGLWIHDVASFRALTSFETISDAFVAAQARVADRSARAAPILHRHMSIPPELAALVAAYASLVPR